MRKIIAYFKETPKPFKIRPLDFDFLVDLQRSVAVTEICLVNIFRAIWDHSFSKNAKFHKKLTLLLPPHDTYT